MESEWQRAVESTIASARQKVIELQDMEQVLLRLLADLESLVMPHKSRTDLIKLKWEQLMWRQAKLAWQQQELKRTKQSLRKLSKRERRFYRGNRHAIDTKGEDNNDSNAEGVWEKGGGESVLCIAEQRKDKGDAQTRKEEMKEKKKGGKKTKPKKGYGGY